MEGGQQSLASRANGRPSTQLFVNQEDRKPLFGHADPTANDDHHVRSNLNDDKLSTRPNLPGHRPQQSHNARGTSSGNVPSHHREDSADNAAASGESRQPKSNTAQFSQRKPLSLTEAMKLAEQEEARGAIDEDDGPIDASPSPAPRAWRARRDIDQGPSEQQIDEALRSPSKLPVSQSIVKDEPIPDLIKKDAQKFTGGDRTSWRDRSDWRRRSQPSDLDVKGIGSLREDINPGLGIPDLVPGIEDLPLPTVENNRTLLQGTAERGKSASPEKSFAWQIDDDFTAGDLQVSDSPRIKTDARPFANRLPFDESSEIDINSKTRVNTPGSRNTKLDEIRSREVKAGNNIPIDRAQSRTCNTRLDEILAREAEVQAQIPIPERRLGATRNTKLDDIRQRETEGLTERQLANAKLDDIREQNLMARSKSPEEKLQTPAKSQTPRTRPPWNSGGSPRVSDGPTIHHTRTGSNSSRPGLSHTRSDSRDLLRQLARATSASPASSSNSANENKTDRSPASRRRTEGNGAGNSTPHPRGPRRALTSSNVSSLRGANGSRGARSAVKASGKPTVGFAGLRRVRSTESSSGSKRSSTHSDDPTDRIEGEAKLFAPSDNYSERGSIRASSPGSGSNSKKEGSDGAVVDTDATPKAKRDKFLSMPTPRAPGAFIETPATVKVEKFDIPSIKKAFEENQSFGSTARRTSSDNRDTISEPGEDEKPSAKSTAMTKQRPRTRSLSRTRPPLKNTAKLPSVKDDLLELQQLYNIEDTTLDNFEQVLSGLKAASPELQSLIKELPAMPPNEDSFDLELERLHEESKLDMMGNKATHHKTRSSSEGDLAAYGRMSKALPKILHSIHNTKQGIENLEDQVSHSEHRLPETKVDTSTQQLAPTPKSTNGNANMHQISPDSTMTYISLPIPRLYSYQPHFRFTLLGFFTSIFLAWYLAETAMCGLYCAPKSCTSPPCVWSYDDPTFGVALPVKLDQWTTGGVGRTLVSHGLEEFEDWFADMINLAYGREITDIDTESLSFHEKRAHRRRLRKKGLNTRSRQAEREAGPEVRARWDAWHRERVARDKAHEARSMGYASPRDEDESIGGDQRVW